LILPTNALKANPVLEDRLRFLTESGALWGSVGPYGVDNP